MDQRLVEALDGHTPSGETAGRYAKGFPVKTLYEHGIAKLDFRGLDLSHIPQAHYIQSGFKELYPGRPVH